VAFYELGLLQPQLEQNERVPGMPWGVVEGFLDDERPFPRFLLSDLGLTRVRTEEGILHALEKHFVWIPPFMHERPRLQRLLDTARKPEGDGTDGWDPIDKKEKPPKPPSKPLPAPAPLPDLKTCLTPPRGTWSIDAWGLLLCLDSPCAEAFAYELESYTLAGSFKTWATTVGGIVLEAIKYGAGMSMLSFIVAVALTIGVGILKINILTENQRSHGRGVCIRFFWFYIPLVGGTAWAAAR
jgi:hypothetical protein